MDRDLSLYDIDRRFALKVGGAVAGVAVLGTAGTVLAIDDDPAPPPSFGHPEVGEKWEQFDTQEAVAFEQSAGPVTVTATQQTVMLENVALRNELREKTLDSFNARLAIAFATRVDVEPALDKLPAGIGRAELMDRVQENGRTAFLEQLQANDVQNAQPVGTTTIETDGGDEPTVIEYEGTYAFDDISVPVTADTSVTIPGDEIEVTGWFATWFDGVGILVAGGVHPGENFARTVQQSLSDGVQLTLDIDLGLRPESYQTEVQNLLGSVE